jgi:hypothetical protein
MLQAKGFDANTDTSPAPPKATTEERFPYGWRYVTKRLLTYMLQPTRCLIFPTE